MDAQAYTELFDIILNGQSTNEAYNQSENFNFIKLNKVRSQRWEKTMHLDDELISTLAKINESQHWILISEPWCGDSAHIVPFVIAATAQNKQIKLEIQLRDSDSEIEKYLTNGSKSIPLLIIRDSEQQDLGVWGARPKKAQEYFLSLKNETTSKEEQKLALQKWYNMDKGNEFQKELAQLIAETIAEKKGA